MMKRFWDHAAVEAAADGFAVRLDGRPVRLPGGSPLLLSRRALAEAVAAEWNLAGGRKGGEMGWDDVPLTRLAGTAQERIAPDPEPVILEIARYGEADLLCYRADIPPALAQRQHAHWQPWLDWAANEHGAQLRVTAGVVHVAQDTQALAALAQAVAAQAPPALAALGLAVPALGSLVLGLAMAAFRLSAEAAFALATIDETFQAERWGRDDEAEERLRRVAADIAVAGRFLQLSR
jgi:chaperone required for assembly of F1-ATPase